MGDSIILVGAEKAIHQQDGVERWKREYQCFIADFDYLPKDDDLASGSSVMILDTGQYAEYHQPSKTWYLF